MGETGRVTDEECNRWSGKGGHRWSYKFWKQSQGCKMVIHSFLKQRHGCHSWNRQFRTIVAKVTGGHSPILEKQA